MDCFAWVCARGREDGEEAELVEGGGEGVVGGIVVHFGRLRRG